MTKEYRVGLMFLLSLSLAVLAILFLGQFDKQVRYRIKFDKVNGLEPDSPVQFNGVPIGRVSRIELDEQLGTGPVKIIVTIALDKSARSHIRTSTLADIRSVGVLGDKYILLLTGDYSAPQLERDDFIQAIPKQLDVDKLLEQGTDFVSDAGEIAESLKKVLKTLADQDGVVQSLIDDPKLAGDFRTGLSKILVSLERDDSALALLTRDSEFASKLKTDLGTITGQLAELSKSFNSGQGLPALIADPEYATQLKARTGSILERMERVIAGLEQKGTLLDKLTSDPEYGGRVSANLDKASYHLASILEKIDTGEGSAALMLNDPSLYQGIHEVVYGLKNSGLSSWYIRKKREKGALMKEDEALKGGNQP